MTYWETESWETGAQQAIHEITTHPYFESKQMREMFQVWTESCIRWFEKKEQLVAMDLAGDGVDWAAEYEMRRAEIEALCDEFDRICEELNENKHNAS